MDARPRVVVVAMFWPTAIMDNAGAKAVLHHVNALCMSGDVTLVVADGRVVPPHDLGVDRRVAVLEVPLSDPVSRPQRAATFATRTLLGEIGPEPYRLRPLREHPGFVEAVRQAHVVEVHWSQWFGIERLVRRLNPAVRVSAFAHDVMTQALRRRVAVGGSRTRRLTAALSAAVARLREPAVLSRYDVVHTFSTKDAALLRLLRVRCPIRVVLLPFAMPAEPWSRPAGGPTVLFLSALYRPENALAARWLIDEVWPAVVAAAPGARLRIAGSGAPGALMAAAERAQCVSLDGYVDDIDALYRDTAVVAVPLRSGAGIKLKVVEALAYGIPVVTTTIGAEGLPRWPFARVADASAAFAEALADAVALPVELDAVAARRSWAVARERAVGHGEEAVALRYAGWAVQRGGLPGA